MMLFYHVQRDNVAGFKIGKTYTFGAGQNFFARDLFAVNPIVPVAGTAGLPVDYLLRDYFDLAGFNHYKNIKSRTISPDPKGLLRSSLSILTHQAMILREFVFEQVRRDEFPEKPSRLNGIWLIRYDEPLLAQWCATAPHGQFRAFEIEATGKVHHGASKYLKPECIGIAQLQENARRYWASDPNDLRTDNHEILCEGEIKVLREIRMPGSKIGSWAKLKNIFG